MKHINCGNLFFIRLKNYNRKEWETIENTGNTYFVSKYCKVIFVVVK